MFLLHYRLSYLCKASVGKATNRRSTGHGSYPDFLFFFPRGFLWQVFSGLRSNRKFIVSGCACSAPVLLSSFKLAFFTCTIFLYFGFSEQVSLPDIMCSFIGFFVQSCGHPSLTSMMYLCTGIYVQSCERPSLTGLIYLCTGIYACPKLWTPQPNWLDIFMYGDLCPKLWTPQPNWLDIFVYGDLCPKLWTPQPNWLDIFVYGDLCPKLWTPQPNWLDLCTGICVQSCGLTGMACLYMMFSSKVVDILAQWHNVFAYRDRPKLWTH